MCGLRQNISHDPAQSRVSTSCNFLDFFPPNLQSHKNNIQMPEKPEPHEDDDSSLVLPICPYGTCSPSPMAPKGSGFPLGDSRLYNTALPTESILGSSRTRFQVDYVDLNKDMFLSFRSDSNLLHYVAASPENEVMDVSAESL